MTDNRGIRNVEKFIEESRILGYDIRGSIFKVDFNGKLWTVGFWIRGEYRWNEHTKQTETLLHPRIGKAKMTDFNDAVLVAIEKAKEWERNAK